MAPGRAVSAGTWLPKLGQSGCAQLEQELPLPASCVGQERVWAPWPLRASRSRIQTWAQPVGSTVGRGQRLPPHPPGVCWGDCGGCGLSQEVSLLCLGPQPLLGLLLYPHLSAAPWQMGAWPGFTCEKGLKLRSPGMGPWEGAGGQPSQQWGLQPLPQDSTPEVLLGAPRAQTSAEGLPSSKPIVGSGGCLPGEGSVGLAISDAQSQRGTRREPRGPVQGPRGSSVAALGCPLGSSYVA